MNKRGFTLVETLVVIAIIGILTSIIIPNLNTARQSGRDAKRVSDIKNIQLALSLYYSDQNPPKYPTALSSLVPTYMSVVPVDPDTTVYKYSAYGASGINCAQPSNPPISYHLAAELEVPGSSLSSQDTDYTTATAACTGSAANFNGNAADCLGTTAASPDPCYDVVQN